METVKKRKEKKEGSYRHMETVRKKKARKKDLKIHGDGK